MAAPDLAPFQLHTSFTLRMRGFGWWRTNVALEGGVIRIASRNARRTMDIPLSKINRVLVGFEHGFSLYQPPDRHRLQIWFDSGSVLLFADGRKDDLGRYAALVRAIAASLQSRGALDRMRIGLPRRLVFAGTLFVALALIGVSWLGSSEATRRATTQEDVILVCLTGFGIAFALGIWTFRQGIHRRVRSIAQLDTFLGVPEPPPTVDPPDRRRARRRP